MPDIALRGCRTTPLMSYLKALGVLLHVSREEPDARLWWSREDHAVLRSSLDADGILDLFLERYAPSPITSPWNGASGYYPKDKASAVALHAVEASASTRLAGLRAVIADARALVATRCPDGAPKGDEKAGFLSSWRAVAPEQALEWLDCAVAVTDEGVAFNPLLGSGGNDGHLEFSANFLGRLAECLPAEFGGSEKAVGGSRLRLRHALLADTEASMTRAAVGMFAPAGAGMPNSTSVSSEPSSMVNPWDFVLMLEGVLLFAGGVARRLSAQRAAFPFTVGPRGADAPAATLASEDRRGETWLPVWSDPASLRSVRRLMAEGRAEDARSQVSTSTGMSRAVATFGVERGVASFERIIFAKRFGRNFIAVPLERHAVRTSREVELLRAADRWIARVVREGGGLVETALMRVRRAAHETTQAAPDGLARWILALLDVELSLAVRAGRPDADHATLPLPLSGLPAEVGRALDDGSIEYRLARSLWAMPVRDLLEPLTRDPRGRLRWTERAPELAGGLRRPLELLAGTAACAEVVSAEGPHARLSDVRAFLSGGADPARIVRMAAALALCERPRAASSHGSRSPRGLDRLFGVAYLACRAGACAQPGGPAVAVRPDARVVRALAAGSASRALTLAVTRLRGSGLDPFRSLAEIGRASPDTRMVAAALAFPIDPADRPAIEAAVLRPSMPPEGDT